jgi:hypothetical protein
MRWLSAQRYRISKAEVNHAPFLLVPWIPVLAGLSYGAGGLYAARNIFNCRLTPRERNVQ